MSVDLLALVLKEESTGNDLEDLKRSVCRNIKYLLESRQPLQDQDREHLSSQSLYDYGLSSRNLGRSEFQANRLCREIEQLLSRFEPRLQNVLVEMERARERGNRLYFRIEGILFSESGHRQPQVNVAFDSVLNLTYTRLSIEESNVA